MAALQLVFSLFGQGSHLLVSLDLYGGTYRLLEKVLSRYGISTTYVDTHDVDALEAAFRPGVTKAVLLETPTSPLMKITDIERVCRWARVRELISIMPREIRLQRGIGDGLLRYSVGLEALEDILGDLEQALKGGG